MTVGYAFELTCPRCGALVEHVAGSHPTRTEASVIVRCTECHPRVAEYQILVRLLPVAQAGGALKGVSPSAARCGTDSGYRAHLRDAETPCEACRAAHAQSVRESKHRRTSVGSWV